MPASVGRQKSKQKTAGLRAEIETLRADGIQRAARTHAAHQRTLIALEAHLAPSAPDHSTLDSFQSLRDHLRDEMRINGQALVSVASTATEEPVLRSGQGGSSTKAGGKSNVAVRGGSRRWSFQ